MFQVPLRVSTGRYSIHHDMIFFLYKYERIMSIDSKEYLSFDNIYIRINRHPIRSGKYNISLSRITSSLVNLQVTRQIVIKSGEQCGIVCECTPRDALPRTSARLVIEEESRCRELLRCVVTSLRTTFIGRLNASIDCCVKNDSEGVVNSSFSS